MAVSEQDANSLKNNNNGIVQGLKAGYEQRQHWARDYICEEAGTAMPIAKAIWQSLREYHTIS